MTSRVLVGIVVLLFILFATKNRQRRSDREPDVASQRPSVLSTTDVAGLPQAQPSQTIVVADGATFDLVASAVQKRIGDRTVKMLAYNGSIPGPVIKVKKGSEITINFTNKTDVETTIHSHGVRVANAFDGTPKLTQDPVPVGGTFAYVITFPDEGSYWYHPHVREDYAQELGLSGMYLVSSDDPNYWSPVNQDIPLMIDDMLLENGEIASFDSAMTDYTLMGRFGNVMLVNGETDYTLQAKQGDVIRLYITNAANTRTFNVTVPGVRVKLVGGDGGKVERERFVESVVIGPSERAIAEVLFEKPGIFIIQHKTPQKTYALGTVEVSAERAATSYAAQFAALHTNHNLIAQRAEYRSLFEKKPDKNLVLTIDMMDMGSMGSMGQSGRMMSDGSMMSGTMMGGSDDPIEWEDTAAMMNAMSTTQTLQWKIVDQDTSKENMDIDWAFKVGDTVKIKIFNDPKSAHPMQHPMHIHGQRFLVLGTNGVENDNLVWKDTVLVKTGDAVELLVVMTNPGTWMAHCHIAEHREDGMMFSFAVSS